jgi:hypothetical protein
LLGIVHSQIDKKGTIFATHEEEAALVARDWQTKYGMAIGTRR